MKKKTWLEQLLEDPEIQDRLVQEQQGYGTGRISISTLMGLASNIDKQETFVESNGPLDIGDSEAIEAASYDASSNTLTITFTSGVTYNFFGVSQDIVQDFENASSYGTFFQENIRDKYSYQKV